MSKSKIRIINFTNTQINKILHMLSGAVEFGGTIVGQNEEGVFNNTIVVESSFNNTPTHAAIPIFTDHVGTHKVIWHTHPNGTDMSKTDIETFKKEKADVGLVFILRNGGWECQSFPKGVAINVWSPKPKNTKQSPVKMEN